jgi:AraC-like DNA-binding protein
MNNLPTTTVWLAQEMEISVHAYDYPAGAVSVPPHTHDEYNFIFCPGEGFQFEARNRLWSLEAGDVLVVNPGELHRGVYGKDTRSAGLTLHIPVRQLKRFLYKMGMRFDLENSDVLFLEKMHAPVVLPAVAELLSEIRLGQPGCDMAMEALLVRILVQLLRRSLAISLMPRTSEIARQLPSWQMVRTLEYMNSRGKNGFSLGELCTTVGSSASRFIQLFKSSCGGVSPHEFYNRLVTAKAERLLRATDFPIKEISFELGFKNESHFCRVFRQYAGTTPGKFRSDAQGKAAIV